MQVGREHGRYPHTAEIICSILIGSVILGLWSNLCVLGTYLQHGRPERNCEPFLCQKRKEENQAVKSFIPPPRLREKQYRYILARETVFLHYIPLQNPHALLEEQNQGTERYKAAQPSSQHLLGANLSPPADKQKKRGNRRIERPCPTDRALNSPVFLVVSRRPLH